MKKIFKMILLSVSFATMIFGCAKFDNNVDGTKTMNSNGEYAIMFSNSPSTKATVGDNGVATYNEFALYTWNSNAEVIMNPYIVKKDGNTWKYDGAADGQTVQYFKNNADNYNFIGVIPTAGFTFNENKVTGNVKSFTIDDSRVNGTITTDSPNEFLYAYKNVEKADYKNDVTLDFKHGNALLYLGFISDDANTKILDYTPYNPGTPGTPGTPGDTTSTQKNAKVLEELLAGNIVPYPYAASNLSASMASSYYQNKTNYGSMSDLVDAVNSQFVYYQEDGKTLKTDAWTDGDIRNKVYLKFADSTDKNAFMSNEGDTYHDAFWNNASNELKAIFKKSYDEGWRVVNISNISGNWYNARLVNNGIFTMNVITITGGSPAVPAVPESGCKGIRVFSAKADATNGYAHVEHTMTADATVSTDLSFDNRVTSSDVIQFSLPTSNVPVGTTEADAIYSPTTFYAIPGDTDLTHFVVKISYEYKGEKVYDVRVPIELPAAGLEAGKYYKYIINITSTGNGTNDPSEADPDKGEIDIVKNPIVVTVNVTDYGKGDVKIITI